ERNRSPLDSLESRVLLLLASLLVFVSVGCSSAMAGHSLQKSTDSVWARDNLVAWVVSPYDTRQRSADERAKTLSRLGLRHYSHIWSGPVIGAEFDAEISALKRHGINPLAWWFPFDPDDPQALETLEIFKRHRIQPQLWVVQSLKPSRQPVNPKDIEHLP